MPKLRQFLARLRVTVNEDKTRVVDAKDGFDFLGVHFRKQPSRRDASRWFCYCWPSQKSMQRIRDKVKAAIGRDHRPSVQEKLDRLNPILRGWSAYFGWLNSAQHFRKVDQYVTWKLRLWLQAKHRADGERSGERHWPTGEGPACTRLRAGLCIPAECRRGKAPGEPYEGKLHVRFDEGVLGTELWNGLRHRRGRKPPGNRNPRSCGHRTSALLCNGAMCWIICQDLHRCLCGRAGHAGL